MSNLFPVMLFERGYTDLISVIPPNATLSPGSKITASQLGKVPGQKYGNGTWGGFNWRAHKATLAHVRAWSLDGANIGLRAGRFPGLDIDSLDVKLADELHQLAVRVLGPAPARFGKRPKRLLMYRTEAPFARMRIWLERDGASHLVELLGEGQQYLVHGTHPVTKQPYAWDQKLPRASQLTAITQDDANRLFNEITSVYTAQAYKVHREGDGRKQERTAISDQSELRAPSVDVLREAVAVIPNDNERFATRESYIKMGYAIRAACGDELEEGLEIFADWAERWENAKGNDPETVRADWRRMHPPFAVGWGWIAGLARGFGFSDAAYDFESEGEPPPTALPSRVKYSDQWLAEQVVKRIGDRLKFAPVTGRWLVWDSQRWKLDELLAAQAEVSACLHEISNEVIAAAQGGARGLKDAVKEVRRIESMHTLMDVMRAVRADKTIAIAATSLDADLWLLNTPSGLVDLQTGELAPSDPARLCTRITKTGPDAAGACPQWLRFLGEATGGDNKLRDYLQRLAGYCLTGVTTEQMLAFIWGPGGNGKTVFLTTLREMMGDYAAIAAMDTFTASNYDKHTTDLADLMGARLVTASETQGGRRWDEQRLKQLSGSDLIKARFMRQDNFTYQPSFKLLFMGNHKPQIRDLDDALRRRIHMVPFICKPREIDGELQEKLRAEYPAILQWAIDGCRVWRKMGLKPPESVLEMTEEYFEDEDTVGKWLQQCTTSREGAQASTSALFDSWREWCGAHGEYIGSHKQLTQALIARGMKRFRSKTERSFLDIAIVPMVWDPAQKETST